MIVHPRLLFGAAQSASNPTAGVAHRSSGLRTCSRCASRRGSTGPRSFCCGVRPAPAVVRRRSDTRGSTPRERRSRSRSARRRKRDRGPEADRVVPVEVARLGGGPRRNHDTFRTCRHVHDPSATTSTTPDKRARGTPDCRCPWPACPSCGCRRSHQGIDATRSRPEKLADAPRSRAPDGSRVKVDVDDPLPDRHGGRRRRSGPQATTVGTAPGTPSARCRQRFHGTALRASRRRAGMRRSAHLSICCS